MAVVTEPGQYVCAASALADGGSGVRFHIQTVDGPSPAFAVRHQGRVHAYLNRCAHRLVELDWEPGQFFDSDGRYLICATHGALYEPATGVCIAGPCKGASLVSVAVREVATDVWLAEPGAAVLK